MLVRLGWICCLITVGAIAPLGFLNQREYRTEVITAEFSNTPSVSFNDVEMIVNSSQGNPEYKLSAPAYWLYHDERRSEFELPEILIYRSDGSKIFARALKGQAYDGNNTITLIGNVKVNQPKTGSGPYISKISTDRLTVFPEKQRVVTDSPVTAIRGSQIVTALGMTLDLDTQVLHLHSDVVGRYAP